MAVVRPVIVGLVAGAVVAFAIALLRPRGRSGYPAPATAASDPAAPR